MQPNRSMPPGQVIPELGYRDVSEAATWLCATFGFSERLRIANHRVQLCYGGGSIIVVAAPPDGECSPCLVHSVMVRVENADEHFARAQRAGARIIGQPTTYPYGERQYTAEDLAGHRWTFSQSVADIHPSQWGGTLL